MQIYLNKYKIKCIPCEIPTFYQFLEVCVESHQTSKQYSKLNFALLLQCKDFGAQKSHRKDEFFSLLPISELPLFIPI
jgi:hypothetical protein